MENPNKIMVASSSKDYKRDGKIKKHIVDFFKWLNNIQQDFTVNSTRKERSELLFLLMQLKKQLSYSISILNMPPSTQRQEFLCEICSSKIILEPLEDIWECLASHCHSNSCVKENSFEEVINAKDEVDKSIYLKSHSHSESSINEAILQEMDTKEENISSTDSDTNSESSSDVMGFKDNVHSLEEYEKADVAGTSSGILSTDEHDLNSSPSLNSDLIQNLHNPSFKSRSWYPSSPLRSTDDNREDSEFNTNHNMDILDNKRENPTMLMNNYKMFSPPTLDYSNTLQSDVYKFRFEFQSRYSKQEESLLYPKFYRKFDLEGDPILQRTGPDRTVCLTCCCELLGQNAPSCIVSHTSGSRHSNATSKMGDIIRNYHDTFLRLDREFQSHQIYFATDDEGYLLKCVVCLKYVRCGDVQAHIMSKLHSRKLIRLSRESKMHSLFYFLRKHVEGYGVKFEEPQAVNESEEVEKPKRNVNNKVHNIVKSTDDSDPALMNKLPGRFSKHLKYLRPMNYSVSCNICDKGTNIFSWKSIRLHLVQPSHLVLTKTPTLNYAYHCDICDKRCHDEITWILHFNDEYKRHKEAAECKKQDKPVEYECSTCKLVLFGDSESLEKHKQSNPIRRTERFRSVTLNKETKEFFSSKKAIEENAKVLWDDAEDVVSRTDLVAKCCEDLENALESKYKFCKAYPFGSRISGLGGSHSDLDIFIDTGSMYNGSQNQDEQNQTLIITNVLNLIRKRKEFTQINSRPTARTPIIQLKHKSTNLDCDVSFVHGLSVENTKFLRYCFELQPISQKLILLVKKWSHLCGLNENITTYALAMLGIFYLQKKKLLLPVQVIKKLNEINFTIIGWETIDYVTPKEEIQKHIEMFDGDITELLIGFFEFYSNFNYKLHVVCPLLGTEISKDLFSIDPKGGALPVEMSSYVKKINTESSPEYFRCLSHFCIQDPFDLSHNLTKACNSSLLNKFVKLCSLTHVLLTKLGD
ncbi:uncharacterized protein LOC123309186 [Coccinella septempunctata]|uniref:uncharacterized protein LOC123309186 n=1 Tax=Coccinella septempunctata TaxID=41139 RepID=UPI001D067035|nr:uncharacterized protein LOC123309186 [Coccinella septempunctata]